MQVAVQGAGWILPVGCALKIHGGVHYGSPLAFLSSFAQGIHVVESPAAAAANPSLSASSHPILAAHPTLDSLPHSTEPAVYVCPVTLAAPFASFTSPLELLPPDSVSPLPSSWSHLASQLSNRSVVVLLGEKDVGKSTLALYLCNSVAQTGRPAYLLDTDPGQPDLSPPSLLSLHCLTAPCALHGPAWTRVRSSAMASHFLGSTTPKHDPVHFMRLVAALASLAAKERILRPGPLIVNTPGWLRGYGPLLQQQIIAAVQGTLLVMLHASDAAPALSLDEVSAVAPDSHTLHLAPLVRGAKSARLAATDARELSLAAYFGGQHRVTLSFAQVDVALPAALPPSQLLRALHASVVGVALLNAEAPAGERHGPLRIITGESDADAPPRCHLLALVQCVDALARRVELVTPVPLPAQRRVRLFLGDMYPSAVMLTRRAGGAQASVAPASSAPYLSLASLVHEGSGAEAMAARPSLQRKKHRKQ